MTQWPVDSPLCDQTELSWYDPVRRDTIRNTIHVSMLQQRQLKSHTKTGLHNNCGAASIHVYKRNYIDGNVSGCWITNIAVYNVSRNWYAHSSVHDTVWAWTSVMRTGCPGLQEYTLSSRSVPPVTKYLPPELNSEHKVWSPIRFFSMNFRGVVLRRKCQRVVIHSTNPYITLYIAYSVTKAMRRTLTCRCRSQEAIARSREIHLYQ